MGETVYKEWGGVILNAGCVNSCCFCNPPRNISKEEIKRQELNIARNLSDFRKQGIYKIEISGSDPIEYKNIAKLIRYIRDTGFIDIQLSTHGRMLSDKKFLKEMIDSGLTRIRIPLYGSNARVHDSITRVHGSFDETLRGIKGLLGTKINIKISCLIMQQNKEDLVDIVNLVTKLGVKDFYFSIPCVSNKDYSYYIPIKNLKPYIRKVYDHCKKIGLPARFHEVPFCILGKFDESFNNKVSPPNLGKYCQPPKVFKTKIKDMPSYRLKEKTKICKRCICYDDCDGFFVNDIKKFGTGKLKPLK